MPFNRERTARVLSHPGNPSKEAVECLAHFCLEQLKQNKITNEQFAILDRAEFDRGKKAKDPSVAKFYNDHPEALTRRRNILRMNATHNRIYGEELVPSLEHLLEQDTDEDGRGDQKLLRLVNKLGFNLEFYTTFRKRAIARLIERAKDRARANAIYTGLAEETYFQEPSEMEIQAEIEKMREILQIENDHEKPALELLANTAYQPQDPNRPVLKLFFDRNGHVYYESSLADQADLAGHKKRIQDINAVQDLAARAKAATAKSAAAAKSSATGANAAPNAAHPASKPANYMNNTNIFGTYYDTLHHSPQAQRQLAGQAPLQAQFSGQAPFQVQRHGQAPAFAAQAGRPTFEQSIGVIVGIFGSFLAKFFEMLMGAKKQSETVLKNANPYRPLSLDEQRSYNADLFEDFRMKLSDENKRNRLVQSFREASTPLERANVIASLKEGLADARLHEDLQTLNFKLCLRSLEEEGIPQANNAQSNNAEANNPGSIANARNFPFNKAHLHSLWRQGPEKRKKALNILHHHMAARGLYRQMEESLRDLEYSTKDSEFLSRTEMALARKTYAEILDELHDIPLQEVSAEFSMKTYFNVRQKLLDEIEDTEKTLAAEKEKHQESIAKLKSDYDSYCEKGQKKLNEILVKHTTMMNSVRNNPNHQKGGAEDKAIDSLMAQYKAVNDDLDHAKTMWESAQKRAEDRYNVRVNSFGRVLNDKLKRIQTEYTADLKLRDESEYIKRNRVGNAAEHQYNANQNNANQVHPWDNEDSDSENQKTYADYSAKDRDEKGRMDCKTYADSNRVDIKAFADRNRIDIKVNEDSNRMDRKLYADNSSASQFNNRLQNIHKQAADNVDRKYSQEQDQLALLGMPRGQNQNSATMPAGVRAAQPSASVPANVARRPRYSADC